jgi:Cdc6-like AAA superfamily ATPase
MTNANFEFRDNSGQIVVGSDNNLQFVTYKVDGSLTICQSEEPPKVKPRKPISQYLSNPSSVPIGREAEIQRCISALKLSQQVEFYGSAGTGKSFLARYLACHPEISSLQHFSDGVIYLYWYKQQSVEDLPQRLFESFYESDRSFKPSLTEIESRLQDKQALVILDDINLSGEELKKLRRMLETLAPRCIFLFTSTERSLWGKGHSILIKGLSKENALSLVEKELGSLTSQERKMVEAIWAALGGNPLEILQQTARVHEGKETLEEVVHRVQLKPSFEQRTKELLNCLGKDQYQILEALAALEVSLLVGQVSVISSVSDDTCLGVKFGSEKKFGFRLRSISSYWR